MMSIGNVIHGATLRVSDAFFRSATTIYGATPCVEDGGRLVGFLERPIRGEWPGDFANLRIENILWSGPEAHRTPTSLHQDGEWQEWVFRQMERHYPDLEHFGSFHHHCSFGWMPSLSDGDIDGYRHTLRDPRYRHRFYLAALLHRPPEPLTDPAKEWADYFRFFLVLPTGVLTLSPETTQITMYEGEAFARRLEEASRQPFGVHLRRAGRAALATMVRALTEAKVEYQAVLARGSVEIRGPHGLRIRMVSADRFELLQKDGARNNTRCSLSEAIEMFCSGSGG